LKKTRRVILSFFLLFYGCLTAMGGWGLNYCLSDGRISIRFLHTSASNPCCDRSGEDFGPETFLSAAGSHHQCSDTPFLIYNLIQRPDPEQTLAHAFVSATHIHGTLGGLLRSENYFLFPPPRSAEISSTPSSVQSNVLLL